MTPDRYRELLDRVERIEKQKHIRADQLGPLVNGFREALDALRPVIMEQGNLWDGRASLTSSRTA